jgi:hypothetical protein
MLMRAVDSVFSLRICRAAASASWPKRNARA